MSRYPVLAVIAAFFLGLTGCDGSLTGTPTGGTPAHSYSYVVAGYLTGQNPDGPPVTLVNNGKDTLTLGASGGFQFPTPLANGATYSVTLAAQPYGEMCAVTNGTGTVNVSNVTSILVSCSGLYPIFTIGGNVAGLSAGASVTLKNNGSDTVTVSANGAFVFPASVYDAQAYDVTVGSQPAGETCTATQAIGTVPRVNIANVSIVCTVNGSKTYSVGGTVSGLGAGTSVTLLDNGVDATTVSNNGAFTFPTALQGGTSWAVTVGTEPAGETCSVSNANGANIRENVTAVTVACSPNQTYSIEGNVSNLPKGTSVALQNNGADLLTVPTDGTFIFGTQLASGATYNVTVATQPPGGNCVVSNGSGTVGTATVTAVSVNCAAPPFIYAPVPFSKSIDAFAFNALTGVVTPLALSSVAAGGQAQAIVLNSARTLAYVVLNDKATVVKFAINASDGTLTPVAGVVGTGNDPQDIVITPSGKFAYVANAGSNSVSGYAIDATTGALTPIAGGPFAAGSVPRRIAIDPTGRFAFVANSNGGKFGPGSVSAYTIDAVTGSLTPVPGSPFTTAPFLSGDCPQAIAINSAGTVIYTADEPSGGSGIGGGVATWSVDQATGALALIGKTDNGVYFTGIKLNPAGTFLYAGEFPGFGQGIYAYAVDSSSGGLTPITGSPFPIPAIDELVNSFAIPTPGNLLYVATGNGLVGYAVDANTGALALILLTPVAFGDALTGIAITP